LVRGAGWLWLTALIAGVSAVSFAGLLSRLWERTAGLTFAVVELILRPLLTNLTVDVPHLTLETPAFTVTIHKTCSGLQGVGLVLVFGAVWLWLYRREYRFPHALLLLPVGALVSWLLNSVRIAALVLIGNAGAPEAAVRGFHSEAGWIAFIAIALSLSIGTQKVAWLKKSQEAKSHHAGLGQNPAVPWLLPFLAVLAAGIFARAVTGTFVFLYPLRFLAAAVVLWCCRATYKSLDWRVSWFSPLLGVVVFFLWIALEPHRDGHVSSEIQKGLASFSASAAFIWLTFRVAEAVTAVPLVEELAFRGFLIRRMIRSDFDSLNLTSFTWWSVLISAVAFGLMHGDRWIAGTLAGLIYSLALLWRGRIGDAFAAHATTNALIAGCVLVGGQWSLW
jgi:exosortase E/protease (VPEID-CTERM system)